SGSVDGCCFDDGPGHRLQARQEENEVVADLLPGGSEDDEEQRLVAVVAVVPWNADGVQAPAETADRRVEYEQPQNRGDRRSNSIRPDQQGPVGGGAADYMVRHDCQ